MISGKEPKVGPITGHPMANDSMFTIPNGSTCRAGLTSATAPAKSSHRLA